MTAEQIIRQLKSLADPKRAASALKFFKPAQAEGDTFIGIATPTLRDQVKKYRPLPLTDCLQLLHSPLHEIRMFALLMMVANFKTGDAAQKEAIYQAYLDHRHWVNNWDLVDGSCYFIVGPYLKNISRSPLYQLAKSERLWDRRIAMVSTLCFIRDNDFIDTLKIAEILLSDNEDLIHKAVGWMLKEVGKRDPQALKHFLNSRYTTMPRTMLRTAIEKFSNEERRVYLER